jgi:hypothetical protein
MNPGRAGCSGTLQALPVQVWATWFPRSGKPESFIQGFPLGDLELSPAGKSPFHFQIGPLAINENSCRGTLQVAEHIVSWDLHYTSSFHVTLSSKGWIGFSRTPHSDAHFSGRITMDGRSFEGSPLGFGVQGHNCGFRHRNFWTWAHAYFPRPDGPPTTCEALIYEMPFGLVFRKAVLWHCGQPHEFRNLQESRRDPEQFVWNFHGLSKEGIRLEATIDGSGTSLHRLPYVKTNCTGSFEVTNNSLARAVLRLERPGKSVETFETDVGAVLEMVV